MSSPQPVVRAAKRRIDGLLLLDKSEGLSSNHALQRVKRLFNAEKAGHTGTLDPFASGLLPICFGEATKFASFSLEATKRYEATVQLGVTTDTGDREGAVLQRAAVAVTRADIDRVLADLHGEIMQTPPMYSAIKKNGKALYEYARQGIEVERQPRAITIFALTLLAWRGEELDIRVTCSKGTYIRTLAEQIGMQLRCGAHLSQLRRTGSGAFDITSARSLDALGEMDEAQRLQQLLPPQALVGHLPAIDLSGTDALALQNGQRVAVKGTPCEDAVAVFGPEKRFFGVARAVDGYWRAQRLMAPEPQANADNTLRA